ncbi:MAG: calcium/sodium antiporter [Gammaproteobacteria bacterium]|nr:calcium/sodium antiporter [Gammaproteobacteria bacterium]
MLLYCVVLVAGLGLLVWSADRFVFGASATSRNLGVPPIVIGLTVVGVGTSAPEILVSAMAAADGNPGLAIGNALGSNIANIGLVLGATALVSPIAVRSRSLRLEFPVMFAVMLLAWLLLADGRLGVRDGWLLVAAFVALLALSVWIGLTARPNDPIAREMSAEVPLGTPAWRALLWLAVGLALLLASSRLVVWAGVGIARALEVSDLLIGLTIVAIGTSLPELAASLTSVIKKEPDIAVGNVIGSNMFNLLPVLALPGLIAPGEVPPEALQRDFPVMVAISIALLITVFAWRGPSRIDRWEGAMMLLAFLAYQVLLYFSAT